MMHERLKSARISAGYKTATEAIDLFGWSSSTYRAHENGQNNFKLDYAKLYAEAYGVNPSWLLFGEADKDSAKDVEIFQITHKHKCEDLIFAAAMLLQEDPTNIDLIKKIESCLSSLKEKIK